MRPFQNFDLLNVEQLAVEFVLCGELHTVDDDGHRRFRLAHRCLPAHVDEGFTGVVRLNEGDVRGEIEKILRPRDAGFLNCLFAKHLDGDRHIHQPLIALRAGDDDLFERGASLRALLLRQHIDRR